MDSVSKVAGLTNGIRADSVVRVHLALWGRLDPEGGPWVLLDCYPFQQKLFPFHGSSEDKNYEVKRAWAGVVLGWVTSWKNFG